MSQSMEKGLALLGHVANGSDTLPKLAAASDLPKSTTYRLLTLLARRGLLRMDGHRYRLGYRLMELGELAKQQLHLPPVARPHMDALAALSKETIHLGELSERDVVYLEKVEGLRGLTMRSRVGLTSPACTTAMGKAIVAHLPQEEWLDYFRPHGSGSPNAIDDPATFRAELEAVLRDGVAYDREENEVGIVCVAAPILGPGRRPAAAISLSGAVVYLPPARLHEMAAAVAACAGAIQRDLRGSA